MECVLLLCANHSESLFLMEWVETFPNFPKGMLCVGE